MTSTTPLRRVSSSPPPGGVAESFSLTEPICCVVQLTHQKPGVVHQVTLDPEKVKDGLIRLGEWPGDEANGWQMITNVRILVVLGRAIRSEDSRTLTVTPIMAGDKESDHAVD